MIASLTIAGLAMPLTQATLRRGADAAEMSLKLAGMQTISIDAAAVLTVGDSVTSGVVASANVGTRSTSCTVTVAPATGSGEYAPAHIHAAGSGMVRGDVDFAVLPGDVYRGIVIEEVTHTIGATSPAFTEARY